MKKIKLAIVLSLVSLSFYAQNASVEKSIFGIQTGFLGVWVHNEARLSNQFALRSEIGLDTGIQGSDSFNNTKFVLSPTITLEPRWYYNLDKRLEKGKSIKGNSGNFLSIKTSFHPDWFVISNRDNVQVTPDISIIPTWGIRRTIGKHFTYETGIGLGYVSYFPKDINTFGKVNKMGLNLHLRIGYQF
ncbi:MAG: hypothetical protein HWD85_00410 [Flavobacteriaceae bacterium]|nr:hypothetical protein [Flavobacteriaceae bacterium]